MARRTLALLAVSAMLGLASIATVSTDAFAHRKAVRRHLVAPPPAPVLLLTTDHGSVADRTPRCIDSVIFYPYPPCY